MRLTLKIGALAIGLLAATAAFPAQAHGSVPAGLGHYEGAGSIVASPGSIGTPGTAGTPPTLVDNGAVVCRDTNGDGAPDHGRGGACLRFADIPASRDSIYVHDDAVADSQLAFQVCIDNNGDGICGGAGGRDSAGDKCGVDTIFFSHAFDGSNHNPLWLPRESIEQTYWECNPAGGFPGYVVILCAGVHNGMSGLHDHQATTGTVKPVAGGTGFGDFCGAPTAAKAYEVV